MKYFKNRRNFFWINQTVIFSSALYLVIIIAGILGVLYSNSFAPSMKYLFLTPSYLNNTALNWTTSVWVGVLGIHGTIAALSITFMGMFVSQVSSYSESGFEDICKSLLLKRVNFLIFSLNSVFSLLSGIVLLAFGGGMIAYVISIVVSLYFIFSYGLMYLKLYSVTVNPTIINDYLFMGLKSTGENYCLFNNYQQEIIREFNKCCEGLRNVNSGWSSDFLSREQRALDVFTEERQMVLCGFCSACLEDINSEIEKNIDNDKVKLFLNLSFHQNVSYSSFSIEFEKGFTVNDEFVERIEKMLSKALFTKNVAPDEMVFYRNYEQAVIKNIRNSLLKGNEWGLDFGVKALFTLTDKNDVLSTMSRLDHSFGYTNKKNSIDYSIFAAFFEKVSSEIITRNDFKKASEIMGGVINLGRYLYTNDYFYEFYALICCSLHSRVKYGFGDDDYSLFDLYVYTVRQNILCQNYMSFELNTKFLTEEFRYLEHADDGESLSAIESKMVQCVKDVVTLILIRLDYLRGKGREGDNEFTSLCGYLKSWVNAAFFEDVYYKEGAYDALFIIPRKASFDESRILREIPDYQVSSVSISNDAYKAIASIMTQSSFNKNNLNPIFIRNKKEFLEKTGISTFQLQAIISYLRSEQFTEVLELIDVNSSDKSNKESVAEYLDSIVIQKNDIIADVVACSELDDELVQKYRSEVSVSLLKYLDKILDAEAMPISNSASSDTSYSLINKREVMNSIDGVHYSMSGSHHAEVGVYHWLRSILEKVKVKKKNIIEIENLKELPTDRLVTIQNMVKGESGVYRYSKGLRMSDEKGVLGLGGAGLYYMDFENEFQFTKGQSLLKVEIEKISAENIESMGGAMVFGGENPFLYARLAVTINLELIDKEDFTFYFLSVENCKKLTALRDHSVRLNSDKGTLLNDSKNIS